MDLCCPCCAKHLEFGQGSSLHVADVAADPQPTTCARCRAELAPIIEVRLYAEAWRYAAEAALRSGDSARARSCAGKSWELQHDAHTAWLLMLAGIMAGPM